jgi:hypothetical protein
MVVETVLGGSDHNHFHLLRGIRINRTSLPVNKTFTVTNSKVQKSIERRKCSFLVVNHSSQEQARHNKKEKPLCRACKENRIAFTATNIRVHGMVWYGMFRGGFHHALRPLCGLLYIPCEYSSSRHTLSPWLHRSPHLPKNVGTITWRRNWRLWWTENVRNFAQRSPWDMRFFNVQ